MSDTPRTDEAAHSVIEYAAQQQAIFASAARQLERELNEEKKAEHAARQFASDNSDWFDSLVSDLSAILGCEKTASAVIQAASANVSTIVRLTEGLQAIRTDCALLTRTTPPVPQEELDDQIHDRLRRMTP